MTHANPRSPKASSCSGTIRSAAWGGGSIVEVHKGYAYVGRGRRLERQRAGGFHRARRARSDAIRRRCSSSARRPASIATSCASSATTSSTSIPSGSPATSGSNARAGIFIFDISKPDQPQEVGFYDTPGSGPHRFGVDNKRKLAFLPNDAPGWNKRVIWTLDVKRPAQAGRRSASGACRGRSPKATASGNDPMPARERDHAARPADDPRQPHVLRVLGRRHRDHRLHRPRQHEAGRPSAMVAAVSRLDPHLPGRSATGPISSSPTRRAPSRNTGTASSCGSSTCAPGDQPDPGRDVLPRAREDISTARAGSAPTTSWRTSAAKARGPTSSSSPISMPGCARSMSRDPLRPKEVGCYVPELPDDRRRSSRTTSAPTSNGRLYLIDRAGAGMHILEYTGSMAGLRGDARLPLRA